VQRLPLQVTGWSGRHPSWSLRDQEDGCPALTHHPHYKLVGNLAVTVMLQLCVRLVSAQLRSGGEMLLVGLMLLLTAFLKARDVAMRRAVGGDPRNSR
jgi:hypothetical protein